jgi:hypothetical protein
MKLTIHLNLLPRLRTSGAIPPILFHAFMFSRGKTLPFTFFNYSCTQKNVDDNKNNNIIITIITNITEARKLDKNSPTGDASIIFPQSHTICDVTTSL